MWRTFFLGWVLGACGVLQLRAEEVKPQDFDFNQDGKLSEAEVIEFLLVYDNVGYGVIQKEPGNTFAEKKKMYLIDQLDELDDEHGGAPYSFATVNNFVDLGPAKNDPTVIKGILNQSYKDGDLAVGPFRLREKEEDWDKDLAEVTGATFSYVRDFEEKQDSWLTQGALIYPIMLDAQAGKDDAGKSPFKYSEFNLLPTVRWNYVDISKGRDKDVQELEFKTGLNWKVLHNTGTPDKPWKWRSEFYVSPFYLTDFDFDGSIAGGEFSYEPVMQYGGFETGAWHSLFGDLSAAYLLRVIPTFQYSRVLSESDFIQKKGNPDVFGGGAKLELGLRPFGKNAPWELRVSYDFLYDFLDGDDDFRGLFEAQGIWWVNDNIGIDIKYQNGETTIAVEDVHLLTAGFQIRL